MEEIQVEQQQQEKFITEEISEMIDSGISDSSNFPIESEQLISTNIIEVIKAPSKSISSESYVINSKERPNSNVKNRQMKAEKSSISRPQAARDRLNSKKPQPKMETPHELGKIPDYLKNAPKRSSHKELPSRPLTSDSIVSELSQKSIMVDIKLTPEQEKRFGESKSVPSTPNIQKSEEVQELKKKLTTQSNTIDRDKKKIEELKNRITTLENRYKEVQLQCEKTQAELNDSKENNKSLGLQLVRLRRDEKDEEKSIGKIDKLEREIEKLVKEKEDMNFEMMKMAKVKNNEIDDLKMKIEKLKNSLEKEKSTCEFLNHENKKLQLSMNDRKNLEDGDKISSVIESDEFESLKKELQNKINELTAAKQDNKILTDQIDHLKNQQFSFTNGSNYDEKLSSLEEKITKMKKREEELSKNYINLQSKFNQEKIENESSKKLLIYRADHIKTLQEAESVLNCRIVFQFKEIEKLRKELKDFEKFKLAYEEEKQNYKNTFKCPKCDVKMIWDK